MRPRSSDFVTRIMKVNSRFLLLHVGIQFARSAYGPELLLDAGVLKSFASRNREGMGGLKVVPRAGQTVYRDLRFTGGNLIKTSVIARFTTKRKRLGLFKGELWLNATTGDFARQPMCRH